MITVERKRGSPTPWLAGSAEPHSPQRRHRLRAHLPEGVVLSAHAREAGDLLLEVVDLLLQAHPAQPLSGEGLHR